jgi:hypothetical protein
LEYNTCIYGNKLTKMSFLINEGLEGKTGPVQGWEAVGRRRA